MLSPTLKLNNQTFWFIESSKSSFEPNDVVSIEDGSANELVGIIQYLDDDGAGVRVLQRKGITDGTWKDEYVSRSKLRKRHLTAKCRQRLNRELESQGLECITQESQGNHEHNGSRSDLSTETSDTGKQVSEQEHTPAASKGDNLEPPEGVNTTTTRELQIEVENQKKALKQIKNELENANARGLEYKSANEKVELKLADEEEKLKNDHVVLEQLRMELFEHNKINKNLERSLAEAQKEALRNKEQANCLKMNTEQKDMDQTRDEVCTLCEQQKNDIKELELKLAREQRKCLYYIECNNEVERRLQVSLKTKEGEKKAFEEVHCQLMKQEIEIDKLQERLLDTETEARETKDGLNEQLSNLQEEKERRGKAIKQLRNALEVFSSALNSKFDNAREGIASALKSKVDNVREGTDEHSKHAIGVLEKALADKDAALVKLQKEALENKKATKQIQRSKEDKIGKLFAELASQNLVVRNVTIKQKEAKNEALKYKMCYKEAQRKNSELEAHSLAAEGHLFAKSGAQKLVVSGGSFDGC